MSHTDIKTIKFTDADGQQQVRLATYIELQWVPVAEQMNLKFISVGGGGSLLFHPAVTNVSISSADTGCLVGNADWAAERLADLHRERDEANKNMEALMDMITKDRGAYHQLVEGAITYTEFNRLVIALAACVNQLCDISFQLEDIT